MLKTKTVLKAPAKRLLERVAKHIEQDYRRLDMETWGHRFQEDEIADAPPCRTTGCIAGWVVLLGKPQTMKLSATRFASAMERAPRTACALLGSSWHNQPEVVDGGADDGWSPVVGLWDTLFYVDDWPKRYRDGYYDLSDRARARRTRVRYFIKHGR